MNVTTRILTISTVTCQRYLRLCRQNIFSVSLVSLYIKSQCKRLSHILRLFSINKSVYGVMISSKFRTCHINFCLFETLLSLFEAGGLRENIENRQICAEASQSIHKK